MNRRQLLAAGLSWPLFPGASALAKEPIFIADMHSHLFFFGAHAASANPLARSMAAGGATLVAWSLVGDLLWLRPTAQGLEAEGCAQARRGEGVAGAGARPRQAAHRRAGPQGRAHARGCRPRAQGRAARGAGDRGRELLRRRRRPDQGRLRCGRAARAARALHQEHDRRLPDREAHPQRAVGVRQKRGGGVQPARHADRSGALHGRCGDARRWRSPRRRWCGRTAR